MMDVTELKRKAEAGNCAAQSLIGAYYLFGHESIRIDYTEAFRFLSAAARRGSSRAVANLAFIYEEGLGIPRDIAKAIELYEAVGTVEFFAAVALGRIYSKGREVPVDPERAFRWYSAAAAFEGRIADCAELTEAKAYVAGAK